MALRVADNLTNEPVRNGLVQLAVQNAAKVGDKLLDVSEAVGFLWKFSLSSESVDFDSVANIVKAADPSRLGQVIEDASPYLEDASRANDTFAVLASIASKRIAWLRDQTQRTWEMPEAEFPENAKVQEFLRGPGTSMVAKEVVTFKTLQDARNYAAKSMRKGQVGASFVMEASEQDGTAFLTVTKIKAWFSKHQHLLLQYKKDMIL
ncbi:hypothetical protein PI124_g9039 [Phytophthora idaei]|nr:hypothetical protein PI125_g13148 [Phytophthora idaei]KAG3149085.1 hypothetical protein PI126_g12192 [Phytophthora idaei]KAG3246224.1 hypothetical protein PI124_g9039 [Phytophthora idaei]